MSDEARVVQGSIRFLDEKGNELDVAPAVPPPAPTDSVVDAWFVETFHNVPISTELFNRFSAAKERLKAQLAVKEG